MAVLWLGLSYACLIICDTAAQHASFIPFLTDMNYWSHVLCWYFNLVNVRVKFSEYFQHNQIWPNGLPSNLKYSTYQTTTYIQNFHLPTKNIQSTAYLITYQICTSFIYTYTFIFNLSPQVLQYYQTTLLKM